MSFASEPKTVYDQHGWFSPAGASPIPPMHSDHSARVVFLGSEPTKEFGVSMNGLFSRIDERRSMYRKDGVTSIGEMARQGAYSVGRFVAVASSVLALMVAGCDRHEDAATAKGTVSKPGAGAPSTSSAAGTISGGGDIAAGRPEVRPETPLFNAVRKRDLAAAHSLLENGAEVNALNVIGRTPLHTAAFYDRGPIAELLIDKGALVNEKDADGLTPLHAAVLADNRVLATLLISKGAEINAQTNLGLTPLHLASATGQNEMLRLLIQKGARLDVQDSDGGSPLFYASRNGHTQTAALLEAKKGKP